MLAWASQRHSSCRRFVTTVSTGRLYLPGVPPICHPPSPLRDVAPMLSSAQTPGTAVSRVTRMQRRWHSVLLHTTCRPPAAHRHYPALLPSTRRLLAWRRGRPRKGSFPSAVTEQQYTTSIGEGPPLVSNYRPLSSLRSLDTTTSHSPSELALFPAGRLPSRERWKARRARASVP